MTHTELKEQKAVEQQIPKLYWKCDAWNCKTQQVMTSYVDIEPINGVVTPEMVIEAKKEFFRNNLGLIRMDLFRHSQYVEPENED